MINKTNNGQNLNTQDIFHSTDDIGIGILNPNDKSHINTSVYIPSDCDLNKKLNSTDKVNHPDHYAKRIFEAIDVIKDVIKNVSMPGGTASDRTNSLKYLLRAGAKTESNYTPFAKRIEDLEKAIWYIKDEIKELQKLSKENDTEELHIKQIN